jgi:hypothetical protein
MVGCIGVDRIPVTSYQLPVTSYQLPVTSYQLPVTNKESIDVSGVVKAVLTQRVRGVLTLVSTVEIILSRSKSSVLIY